MPNELEYRCNLIKRVTFAEEVLAHFDLHRQSKDKDREAGGQLFAKVHDGKWTIVKATGPRLSDWRSRFGFRPNRNAERAEIKLLFESGLHFVGDWHTHPQSVPIASDCDLDSMGDQVTKSTHELPGFLMVIVGLEPWPSGLWVTLHTGSHWFHLTPA